jgi:hypothetical protein
MYTNESYYRRAPFTISVEFSPTDSVVAASFWLDPPIGTQALKPSCLHSINGGNEQRRRIERWMTTHGESATTRRSSPDG